MFFNTFATIYSLVGGCVLPRGKSAALVTMCLLILLSSFIWMRPVHVETIQNEPENTRIMTLSSYALHDPIDIRNDTALAFYAVSGTGNPGMPYILEGWNITTENGPAIRIMGTTKYFVVRDCWLRGTNAESIRGMIINVIAAGTAVVERVHLESWFVGIEVSNAPGIAVKGCTIQGGVTGLIMNSAANSTVFNNTVYKNDEWGLWLSSNSMTIANNTLWSNGHGLGIFYGTNSVVENNTLSDDGFSFSLNSVAIYETISEKNNLVNGLPLLYAVNEIGTTHDGGVGQAILINCTNVKLINQDLSHCETGAFLRWCNNCRISESTFDYNDNSGLYASYSYNLSIAKTSASWNTLYGFQLIGSTVNITSCEIMENQRGIDLPTPGGEVSIHGNNFAKNVEYGVILKSQWNMSVTDNTFTDDGIHCLGNSIEEYARYAKNVTGNVVNGKPLGFYYSMEDVIISSPHGQIFIANCSNVVLASLDCSNTVIGIGIAFSNSCSIINSDCSHVSAYAICLTYSNFTLVQNVNCDHSIGIGIFTYRVGETSLIDNRCTNNYVGIDFSYSWSGLIRGNILTDSHGNGLRIRSSQDVTAYGNACDYSEREAIVVDHSISVDIVNNTCNYGGTDGISILDSLDLLVHSNDCMSNSYSGIYLDNSWLGILASNRLEGNGRMGLYMTAGERVHVYWNTIFSNGGHGMYCIAWSCIFMHNIIALNEGYGAYLISCNNVSIHHNSFVNNNNGSCQASEIGVYTNLWYDPIAVEGNYYSDWNGDGPYFLDGSSEAYDLYPLGETDTDSDTLWDSWEIAHGLDPYSSDTDSDLLPDAWEVMYGLNPLVDDSTGDLDEDGVSNIQEYLLGLNPSSEDSDGDLMPDLWELENYLNPLFNDAGLDPDGDGVSNLNEYLGGTNPHVSNTSPTTSATTVPTTTSPATPSDTLTIAVAGVGGFALAIVLIFLIQRKPFLGKSS